MVPPKTDRDSGIVTEALGLPAGQRSAFVDKACGGDAALKLLVTAQLNARDRVLRILDRPAVDLQALVAMDELTAHAGLMPGQIVGPYEIDAMLGEGGMGVVYRASSPALRRTAAVKVVKGPLATPELLAQFSAEIQALAAVRHPNIATLYDAGFTSDGLPYFGMEYVDGPPIDQFCAERRLSVEDRLRLFLKVCAAVSAVHEHPLVHRDITARNVLVAANGEPRLLDFGLAKLLGADARGDAAQTAAHWMTAEFASPEQLERLPITTRSDIYSLGVLLFLLLAGRVPFGRDAGGTHELVRRVRSDESPRPSDVAMVLGRQAADAWGATPQRLAHRLRGDLDNIVLKALEKSPTDRYASARDLATDIERHLGGEPISARPQTASYRASKFVRRHAVGVAVTAVILMTLVAAAVAVAYQAQAARAARAVADRRFNDVRALANSFLFEFHDAIATLEGSTPARQLVVERALQYLDALSREGDDPQLQRELASAYEKVGLVQGDPYSGSLGHTDQALESQRKALALRTHLGVTSPAAAQELASSHLRVGDILWVQDRWDEARAHYDRARVLGEEALRDGGNPAAIRGDLVLVYTALGDAVARDGPLAQARAHHERSLELRRLAAASPTDPASTRGLAIGLLKVADIDVRLGRLEEALRGYSEAITILSGLARAHPDNAQYRSNVIGTLQRQSVALAKNGESAAAIAAAERAVAEAIQLARADEQNAFARRELASSLSVLGAAWLDSDSPARAEAPVRQFRSLATSLEAADPSNMQARRDHWIAQWQLARALTNPTGVAEAERIGLEALRRAEQLSASGESPTARDDLADTYDALGRIQTLQRRFSAAEASFEAALALSRRLHADYPDDGDYATRLASVLDGAGDAQWAKARTLGSVPGRDQAQQSACSLFAQSHAEYRRLTSLAAAVPQDLARVRTLERKLQRCAEPR